MAFLSQQQKLGQHFMPNMSLKVQFIVANARGFSAVLDSLSPLCWLDILKSASDVPTLALVYEYFTIFQENARGSFCYVFCIFSKEQKIHKNEMQYVKLCHQQFSQVHNLFGGIQLSSIQSAKIQLWPAPPWPQQEVPFSFFQYSILYQRT